MSIVSVWSAILQTVTPVLHYEQPLHAQRQALPRKASRMLLVGGAVLACLPLIERVLLHLRMGTAVYVFSVIGPVIGAAALLVCSSLTLVTKVFGDRLQWSLFSAGIRLWGKKLPLATLAEVEVVRTDWKTARGNRQIALLRRSPGLMVVMFFGTGLRLRALGGVTYWLGANDPQAIAAAIAFAKEGAKPE